LTNKRDVGFEFEKREPKTKRERKPKTPATKIDFTSKDAVGECPKCGGKIVETETSYICERSHAARASCKFKLSKTILGRDIPREQAQKLLTAGKTDLLDGFISKRGRPFSAYLKFEDEKVSFEFPEKISRATESKQPNIS
jgi:DNA topoisomerase III